MASVVFDIETVGVPWESLDDAQRTLFRLFELAPGRDLSVPGVAALTGVDPSKTRSLLDELHGASLLEESVPDHQKSFRATVRVGGQVLGSGQGRTKKAAEQQAAEHAWRAITAAENGNLRDEGDGPANGPSDGPADEPANGGEPER